MNRKESIDRNPKPLQFKSLMRININDYTFLKVLGTGAFGAVFLVKKNEDNSYWALKSLSKQHIIEKK